MDEDLKPIRTFEGDIASSVRNNQASVVHIALAEDERRRTQETGKRVATKNVLFGTFGVLFFIAACVLITYVLYVSTQNKTVLVPIPVSKIEGLFKSNKEYAIEIAPDTSRAEVIQKLNGIVSDKTLGNLSRVVIIEKIATTSAPIILTDFVTRIFPKAPDLFRRSLGINFDYGVYEDVTEKPFFIFTSIDYDRTYAGLLTWEKDMRFEVTDIFKNIPKTAIPNSDGTGTPAVISAPTFTDAVIKNIELRILKDQFNKEYLVYGFSKPGILLIAPDTKTFFIVKDALR